MNLEARLGYGAAFNTLSVNDGLLSKTAKNPYGSVKLQKEVAFYRFLERNNLVLSFPRILQANDSSLVMPYYHAHLPFHKIFWNVDTEKQQAFLRRIQRELELLHGSYTTSVSRETLCADLYEEGVAKVLRRYDEVKDILDGYDIERVNGVQLVRFDLLLDYIHEKIIDAGKTLPMEYSLIHGDCQFSNILYSELDDSFLFVDPRGYFGNSDLVGLPQYDFAKLMFALTGYDVFDSLELETLEVTQKNLILPSIPICFDAIRPGSVETILMVSIWLGNAHCFKSNPAKAALSHFYARYIGTLVYMSDRL